ncbi:serine protease [Thalassotalea nanhaiensis]|uniref:Serine protease n=1 Tax=Thalassotalea nanhaiensis TaxID=3065648 RepID=A0ABY9TI51_9GAMM|nr:serine protease [Colwelliaceae bacterium SQ345]
MRINPIIICLILFCGISGVVTANEQLVQTIAQVKPAIVGVGIHQANARPQSRLHGTGFVIGNGHYIVTNYHVLAQDIKIEAKQKRVIFVGFGKKSEVRNIEVVAYSKRHDIAILKQNGPKLPTLKLHQDQFIAEGESIAFTGFPIGAVLGLYPVTHKGIVASITPVVIPVMASTQLSPSMVKVLKNPYLVYQLDATAYPGNSGSPVYLQSNGEVVAVINKVFVQKTKESAITNPSGITYAIPIKFLNELIQEQKLNIYSP